MTDTIRLKWWHLHCVPAWEYGEVLVNDDHVTRARRHVLTGECQFKLNNGHWHPFGPGHERFFTPDVK